MSGKSSSSSSSPLSGSAGLAGFVQSLSATWRIFLLRFVLAFILLALVWWPLAPAYAHLLIMLGRPVFPMIESPAETYWVEGAQIWATRSVFDPATGRPLKLKAELWRGYASYDLILLFALILATPGWSLRQRGRLLGLGLVLITLTEFAFFLASTEYSHTRSVTSQTGSVLLQAGFSRPKQILAAWVYYFFQTMGRSLFPLLIYWGMVGLTWRPVGHSVPSGTEQALALASRDRNAPCPCGSGKRYKRCCGK